MTDVPGSSGGHGEALNAADMVARQVAEGRGDKPAVVAADATLTYEQLRRAVNRAGGLLRELGVRREQRVLLVLDDTTAFPILFLGAMHIGAVPVSVSPLDKDDNFRHFVDDSYAEVVATDAGAFERISAALGERQVRWLVRGGSGPAVSELDAGLGAQSDELDAGADPPRRPRLLALQLGVDRYGPRVWCICTTTSGSRPRTTPARCSGCPRPM